MGWPSLAAPQDLRQAAMRLGALRRCGGYSRLKPRLLADEVGVSLRLYLGFQIDREGERAESKGVSLVVIGFSQHP